MSGLLAELKACTRSRSLDTGRKLYERLRKGDESKDVFLQSAFINMFAKCGSMVEARAVFDQMHHPDVVAWTTLVLGYAENGEPKLALDLYTAMEVQGSRPNDRSYVAALKACSAVGCKEQGMYIGGEVVKVGALETGMKLHSQASKAGYEFDIFVSSGLINMYSKCGSLLDARRVFDRASRHDTVSWNSLLLGYAENGEAELCLQLYDSMQHRGGGCVTSLTYVAALKACSALPESCRESDAVKRVMAIHAEARGGGLDRDIFVASTLVNAYAKARSLVEARRVFDSMNVHSLASCTSLMLGYVDNGEEELALDIFQQMEREGCEADAHTFVAAFKACSGLAAKEQAVEANRKLIKATSLARAAEIHKRASAAGCESETFVGSTLVGTYAKCGSLVDARRVFERIVQRDVVTWTALITGYADNGEELLALETFNQMLESRKALPDSLTFVAALNACTSLAVREQAKQVEGKLIKPESLQRGTLVFARATELGCNSDSYVANSAIDMFAKCRSLRDAQRVFDCMKARTISSWNSLMLGYAETGEGAKALELYQLLQSDGLSPGARTFVAALKACESLLSMATVKALQGEIYRQGLETDMVIVNQLVDIYGKCGNVSSACSVFDSISWRPDSATWTSLIGGLSRSGDSHKVLELFHQMQREGASPDGVTFLCILAACSHAGLVEQAEKILKEMSSRYDVQPGLEHYIALADCLGRANRLSECMELLNGMPFEGNRLAWMTLLGACKKWKNVELGKVAFEKLSSCGGERESASYDLMVNIYRSAVNEN